MERGKTVCLNTICQDIHRGIHTLSANATTLVENVRKQAAHFLGAKSEEEEIVFFCKRNDRRDQFSRLQL